MPGDDGEGNASWLDMLAGRSRKGGRPRKLDNKKLKIAKELLENPSHSIQDICRSSNISLEDTV